MSLRMNLNFNIESIADLERVTKALKEAATLQALVQLESQIKELKAERIALRTVVQALKDERRSLEKDKAPEGTEKNSIKEAEEVEKAEEEPRSAFDNSADSIIDEIGNGSTNEAEAEAR